MKKLLFLGPILAIAAQAEVIEGRIHAIQGSIVKLENGRVAFLDQIQQFHFKKSDAVRIKIDDRSSVITVHQLKGFKSSVDLMEMPTALYLQESDPPFEPTVIDGLNQARLIFDRSNPFYKRVSECTDRAHVWAHDEYRTSGSKSLKAFVFFTASYINSVRFKWWFHVAPLYKVKVQDEVRDLVMDLRYTHRPMGLRDWTDEFVFTKRPCKVTTKFSEYDVNPQTEDCYLMIESMHYRIPDELHQRELTGRLRIQSSESELRMSRRFAFEQ